MKGIDISSWQAGIVPSMLDIDFCIVKATEGTDYTNPYCDGAITDCIDSALPWGFYHYAKVGNPISEAEYFVQECENYFSHGIPVLDYEEWQGKDVAWCESFMQHVHDLTGVWPILYISASRCGIFENSWLPEKCGLWVAAYPMAYTDWISEDTEMGNSIYPWQFAAIWQFTSSLRLTGWSGNLDGNIAYMDAEGWMKYATGGKVQAVSNAPAKNSDRVSAGKTCVQIADEVLQGKWGVGEDRRKRIEKAFPVGTYDHVQNIINERML